MKNDPHFFLGPMSKNIVDTILYHNKINPIFGFIPSRRQIDYNGGYVNSWDTYSFYNYVRDQDRSIIIERDHAGPLQGQEDDDGKESIVEDSKLLDVIHIDPWRKYQDIEYAASCTSELMRTAYKENNNIYFEVSTEEAICPISINELSEFLNILKDSLPHSIYDRIYYVALQTGTSLDLGNRDNTGEFNIGLLESFINLIHSYGLKTKEHNGDYLSHNELVKRFKLGLDAINIAPEIAQVETQTILDHIPENSSLEDELFKICRDSGKWKKWVNNDFNPCYNKREVILICCHYIFSTKEFKELKTELNGIDQEIRKNLLNYLKDLDYVISSS